MPHDNGPWKVLDSVQKYRNEFIEVIEDQVIRPDGEPGSYAVVRMNQGVAVLPLDENGDVYLVRQFRYALEKESLEVVAGSIEEGSSPLETAQKELKEELGIQAEDWESLGVAYPDTSIAIGPVYLFLARNLSFMEKEREGTEVIHTVSIPLSEAVQKVLDGEIVHAASCYLILRTLLLLKGSG